MASKVLFVTKMSYCSDKNNTISLHDLPVGPCIVLTIGVSALCSILEAMILSVTTAELENFKNRKPKEVSFKKVSPGN